MKKFIILLLQMLRQTTAHNLAAFVCGMQKADFRPRIKVLLASCSITTLATPLVTQGSTKICAQVLGGISYSQ